MTDNDRVEILRLADQFEDWEAELEVAALIQEQNENSRTLVTVCKTSMLAYIDQATDRFT